MDRMIGSHRKQNGRFNAYAAGALLFLFLECCFPHALVAGSHDPDQSPASPDSSAQPAITRFSFDVQSAAPTWHSAVTDIPHDLAQLGTLMVREENLPLIGGVSLMTLGMHAIDDQIWPWTRPRFSKEQRSTANRILVGMGDSRTHFALAGGFASFGLIFDDHRALRTASQMAEAVITTGIVVQALKRMTGKESPAVAVGPAGHWDLFPNPLMYQRNQSRYYSFPSGHTAATMAVVTVIAENYPEYKWLKPAGYAVVGLVEIGLVNAGMHWYGDFPVAMLLGYSCGMIAAGRVGGDEPGIALEQSGDITIRPVVTPIGSAVGFSITF